jgi:hypothetical protein
MWYSDLHVFFTWCRPSIRCQRVGHRFKHWRRRTHGIIIVLYIYMHVLVSMFRKIVRMRFCPFYFPCFCRLSCPITVSVLIMETVITFKTITSIIRSAVLIQADLSIYLSFYHSIYLSIYLSLYLSITQSIIYIYIYNTRMLGWTWWTLGICDKVFRLPATRYSFHQSTCLFRGRRCRNRNIVSNGTIYIYIYMHIFTISRKR